MYGIPSDTLKSIITCFEKYSKIEDAVLYGSRAKGTHKEGSDIDIVLKGKKLIVSDIYCLESDLELLYLPYKFDISIFHTIDNDDLLDHIQRVGISLLH